MKMASIANTVLNSSASNFVLVVDSGGETDILQLSYDCKWEDVSIMLQVKFNYNEMPVFTYTDQEEDFVALDSQESYEEALKICKRNNDVLHIQVRLQGMPLGRLTRSTETNENPTSSTYNHMEMARTAVGNTLDWVGNKMMSVITPRHPRTSTSEDENKQPSTADLSMEEVVTATNRTNSLEETTSQHEAYEEDAASVSSARAAASLSDTDAQELTVKAPFSAVPMQESENVAEETVDEYHEKIMRKIKEEVRLVVSEEMEVFREEFLSRIKRDRAGNSKLQEESLKPEASTSSAQAAVDKPRQDDHAPHTTTPLQKRLKVDEPSTKARKYAASFVCENLLDGSCVEVGQQFIKYWVLKNRGTSSWDERIELRLVEESPAGVTSPVDRNPVTAEGNSAQEPERRWGPERCAHPLPIVESNGIAVIAVSHVAPTFPCIYTSSWRVCNNGKFFGPKIWCSVEVKTECEEDRSYRDSSLSEYEQDYSIVSDKHVATRLATNQEETTIVSHTDNFSNMLSFEVTIVADVNKTNSPTKTSDEQYGSVSRPTTSKEISEAIKPEEFEELEADMKHENEAHYSLENQIPSDIESLHSVDLNENVTPAVNEEAAASRQEDEGMDEDEEVHTEVTGEDVDDNASDVVSDFEVIPLPECFDTSKPLTGSEQLNDEDETPVPSLNVLAEVPPRVITDEEESTHVVNSNQLEINKHAEQPVLQENHSSPRNDQVPVIPTKARSLSADEVPQLGELRLSDPSTPAFSLPSSHHVKPTAPRCLPVPQSILDMDKPAQQKAIPLPQSVLDADKPYNPPVQRVALMDSEWIQQPIPLPRGVLEVDKPWVNPQGANVPSSRPQSSSTSPPQREEQQEPALIEPPAQSAPPTMVERGVSPIVDNPPDHEEEEEEFTLASEAAYQHDVILLPSGEPRCSTSATSIPAIHVEENAAPPAAVQSQSVREARNPTPMEQLVDMGFLDVDLNQALMKEFQGDMNRVVHALVYKNPEERHRRHHRSVPHMAGSYVV